MSTSFRRKFTSSSPQTTGLLTLIASSARRSSVTVTVSDHPRGNNASINCENYDPHSIPPSAYRGWLDSPCEKEWVPSRQKLIKQLFAKQIASNLSPCQWSDGAFSAVILRNALFLCRSHSRLDVWWLDRNDRINPLWQDENCTCP